MATIEGIDATLNAFLASFNEFKLEVKDWKKCINEDINGNGKPGLKQRVYLLEEAQKEDDSAIEEIKKHDNAWDRIFNFIASPKGIATVVAIVVTLLGASGKVALDKINALSDNLQQIEKVVNEIK